MHIIQYLSDDGKKLYNEFKERAMNQSPNGMSTTFVILLMIDELAKLQKQIDDLEASIVR